MKARWKVLIGLGVVLAVLLALNTAVLNQQTKAARVTVPEGQILSLAGGDVQVLDEPAEARGRRQGPPIVLLHCYACSLQWWDALVPLLRERHRVIRMDFLGHGGSEKPSSGYSVEDQAGLVAGALNELEVSGAVVVGQSMGSAMAVALAEESSQLVDRVVEIAIGPTNEGNTLPLAARLSYVPVLGQALYRVTPDFAVRSSFSDAFAPGYDVSEEFEDVIVDGYRAMTYTSFKQAHDALEEYRAEQPLDARAVSAAVPVMFVIGAEDQIVDPAAAEEGWSDVPGIRIEVMEGVGHTPQVEAPEETAALIEEFAAEAAGGRGRGR